MNPEEAIRIQYGVKLGPIDNDGKYRSFKIDDLRNGFILKIEDCAVFGSIIDKEMMIFDGNSYFEIVKEHKESKVIRFEWMIWEIARATFERGERLGIEDRERLALAVKRLEDWL